jgi:HPt (histidine-containing phosphotransfer) domain-containing protein
VICISAAAVAEERTRYTESGMNAFLPKPFTEEMLLSVILSVIDTVITTAESKPDANVVIHAGDLKKINLDNLYHISDGDEKFVKQMLITFIETTEKSLKELNAALVSDQMEQIADLSHKMLAPCRHMGAVSMCDILKKTEAGVKNKVGKAILERLVEESVAEFEVVSEIVRAEIKKIK